MESLLWKNRADVRCWLKEGCKTAVKENNLTGSMIGVSSGCRQCCITHFYYGSVFGAYSTGKFTQGHDCCPENPLQGFWYIPSLGRNLLSLQSTGAYVVVLVRKPGSAEQSL